MKTLTRPPLTGLILLSLLCGSLPLMAVNRTWNNTATDFNDGGSWVDGVAPGSGDRAYFNGTAAFQPQITASTTLQGITFGVTGNVGTGYVLSGSEGAALTLTTTGGGNTSGNGTIGVLKDSGTNTISVPIILGGAADSVHAIRAEGNTMLILKGGISSTNAISEVSLTGTGTYVFDGPNTYQGNTVQKTFSRLIIKHKQAFSTGTLVLESSSAGLEAGIDLTGENKLANPIKWTGSATLYDSGDFGIEFGGNVDLNGAARVITSQISGGATFDGVISNDGGGGLTFQLSNGSEVVLKGLNTYTGDTLISGYSTPGAVVVSQIGNAGVAGNLGAGTRIRLGEGDSSRRGRLIYNGTGETTSKIIELNGTAAAATIEQAGTGTLLFTEDIAVNNGTSTSAKTLTLDGSTSGIGRLGGKISNGTTGSVAILKAGTGTWILDGDNTYTGSTRVDGGTLLIHGDMSAATGTVVSAVGTTLGGTGTLGGAATVNGTLAGSLSFTGALTLASTSTTFLTLQSASLFDSVEVGGAFKYAGKLVLDLGFTPALNTGFDLFDFGSRSGTSTFSSISFTNRAFEGTFDYATGILTITAVPEPGVGLIFVTGGGLLAFWHRRRKRAA